VLKRLATYIDRILVPPSWEMSVWWQIAYGAIECCICTALVGLSYMYGFNLLLSPALLALVYYRDMRAINDNAGSLHWNYVDVRFAIRKFQIPFIITVMSVIFIPFMLPVVIFASSIGSWSDPFLFITTSAIKHSSWFLPFYQEHPFFGAADRISFLSQMERDIFILININNIAMIAYGVIIGMIIISHKNCRTNIERVSSFFVKSNGLSRHNYAFIISPLMYPIFISFLMLQTMGSSFHAHDVVFSSMIIILLSCSVIQIVFLCSSGIAKKRIK
jgi:hypothetical protein